MPTLRVSAHRRRPQQRCHQGSVRAPATRTRAAHRSGSRWSRSGDVPGRGAVPGVVPCAGTRTASVRPPAAAGRDTPGRSGATTVNVLPASAPPPSAPPRPAQHPVRPPELTLGGHDRQRLAPLPLLDPVDRLDTRRRNVDRLPGRKTTRSGWPVRGHRPGPASLRPSRRPKARCPAWLGSEVREDQLPEAPNGRPGRGDVSSLDQAHELLATDPSAAKYSDQGASRYVSLVHRYYDRTSSWPPHEDMRTTLA